MEKKSKEYIFEIGEALFDKKTGKAVFKPRVGAEICRCERCIYWMKGKNDDLHFCGFFRSEMPADGFCSRGVIK